MASLRPQPPPRNTGPFELRDTGPNGRRLGTHDDCYDGCPWELHRGELVERPRGTLRDRIVIPLIATFLLTHARRNLRAAIDVYCDLTDEHGPSVRSPDVVLVDAAAASSDDFIRVVPILAVEVRATQSKKHLDEKVGLYLEHGWPLLWIAHAERRELEVLQPGVAPVIYRSGAEVPLPPELHKHDLHAVPVAALFDERIAGQYADGWVRVHTLSRVFIRKLGRPLTPPEMETLLQSLATIGSDRLTDLALDLTPDALATWLTDPTPR